MREWRHEHGVWLDTHDGWKFSTLRREGCLCFFLSFTHTKKKKKNQDAGGGTHLLGAASSESRVYPNDSNMDKEIEGSIDKGQS